MGENFIISSQLPATNAPRAAVRGSPVPRTRATEGLRGTEPCVSRLKVPPRQRLASQDARTVRACFSKEIPDTGVPALASDRRGRYSPRQGELNIPYFLALAEPAPPGRIGLPFVSQASGTRCHDSPCRSMRADRLCWSFFRFPREKVRKTG